MNRTVVDNVMQEDVRVEVGRARLEGMLTLPLAARGVVLFAHGSGSGRFSPRNQHVAGMLQRRGIGTLLIDLLTGEEETEDAQTGALRFDIELLGRRVVGATDWLAGEERTRGLKVGLFGASTGAAAALVAAAERPGKVAAVVSRGGRPDLAGRALGRVRAPTLLIVGGLDTVVIHLNHQAQDKLRAPVKMVIVPGASHLFEEPGTLDRVARLAAGWFGRYF